MLRFLTLMTLAAVLVPIGGHAAAAPTDSEVAARIDTYVRGRLPHLRTPGVSLVIVDGDEIVFSRGYGLANVETRTPMTEETLVGIASNVKGMTALAVMQLVEQGRLDLDAPVQRYLPAFTMDDERAQDI